MFLGVILGYVMYLCITLFTGELLANTIYLCLEYFPAMEEVFLKYPRLVPFIPGNESDGEEDEENEGDEDGGRGTRSRPPSSVAPPVVRSESTAGGTISTHDTNHTTATATTLGGGSSLKRSKSSKYSNQDPQSVLEAFVDMNPSMSFCGPSELRLASRSTKSTKTQKSARSAKASGAGESEFVGGDEGESLGRPSIELSANAAENSARLQSDVASTSASAEAPLISAQLVSSTN